VDGDFNNPDWTLLATIALRDASRDLRLAAAEQISAHLKEIEQMGIP
jgi:hypothetical protein